MRSSNLAVVLVVGLLSSCATTGRALLPTEGDWQKLGLSPTRIEPWEDGLRTDSSPGTFEWWYLDTRLSDGSTLVVVFYTKGILDPGTGLKPMISVRLTRPDGSLVFERVHEASPAEFSAARERCAVRIGRSTFDGNLEDYTVHLDFDDVKGDLTLHGTTPAWRPATGHSVFVEGERSRYFAWLPAVPRGVVTGTLTTAGVTHTLDGSGYHDHNWGDAPMLELMHDWYWGRADVGPFTVISAYITPTERFGAQPQTVFHLSRDGKLLAEDGRKVTFTLEDVTTDARTGKPVGRVVTYDYRDGETRWRVRYERERDLANTRFVDLLSGFRGFLARLAGFDGAYLRFSGKVTVERLEGDQVVEQASTDDAVWELMYFGHAPR